MPAMTETPKGEAKPKFERLRRMEIEPTEDGGHIVTHHEREKPIKNRSSHSGMSMGYSEPKRHAFGKEEGHEMLAHVANHLGIKELAEDEKDEHDNDDGVGEDGEYD